MQQVQVVKFVGDGIGFSDEFDVEFVVGGVYEFGWQCEVLGVDFVWGVGLSQFDFGDVLVVDDEIEVLVCVVFGEGEVQYVGLVLWVIQFVVELLVGMLLVVVWCDVVFDVFVVKVVVGFGLLFVGCDLVEGDGIKCQLGFFGLGQFYVQQVLLGGCVVWLIDYVV